jgi:hypothetical protein
MLNQPASVTLPVGDIIALQILPVEYYRLFPVIFDSMPVAGDVV